eukprot:2089936-Lingulodinium_polyedra.AAC.1
MVSSSKPCKSRDVEESLPKGSVPPPPLSPESERQFADEWGQRDLVLYFFKHVTQNAMKDIV